jgi:hypothetical protein
LNATGFGVEPAPITYLKQFLGLNPALNDTAMLVTAVRERVAQLHTWSQPNGRVGINNAIEIVAGYPITRIRNRRAAAGLNDINELHFELTAHVEAAIAGNPLSGPSSGRMSPPPTLTTPTTSPRQQPQPQQPQPQQPQPQQQQQQQQQHVPLKMIVNPDQDSMAVNMARYELLTLFNTNFLEDDDLDALVIPQVLGEFLDKVHENGPKVGQFVYTDNDHRNAVRYALAVYGIRITQGDLDTGVNIKAAVNEIQALVNPHWVSGDWTRFRNYTLGSQRQSLMEYLNDISAQNAPAAASAGVNLFDKPDGIDAAARDAIERYAAEVNTPVLQDAMIVLRTRLNDPVGVARAAPSDKSASLYLGSVSNAHGVTLTTGPMLKLLLLEMGSTYPSGSGWSLSRMGAALCATVINFALGKHRALNTIQSSIIEAHHPWNALVHHTLQPVAGHFPAYYNSLHTKQDMSKDAAYSGDVKATYDAYHLFMGKAGATSTTSSDAIKQIMLDRMRPFVPPRPPLKRADPIGNHVTSHRRGRSRSRSRSCSPSGSERSDSEDDTYMRSMAPIGLPDMDRVERPRSRSRSKSRSRSRSRRRKERRNKAHAKLLESALVADDGDEFSALGLPTAAQAIAARLL